MSVDGSVWRYLALKTGEEISPGWGTDHMCFSKATGQPLKLDGTFQRFLSNMWSESAVHLPELYWNHADMPRHKFSMEVSLFYNTSYDQLTNRGTYYICE